MLKPFRLATAAHALQAAILFDKFHVMRHLGELWITFARANMDDLRAATGATSKARIHVAVAQGETSRSTAGRR